MIDFTTTHADAKLIKKIVSRARELAERYEQPFDTMSVHMDLSACVANGTPLKLEEFLAADDFNFLHDVAGISRHMDRDESSPTAGQLLNCFVPRFAS